MLNNNIIIIIIVTLILLVLKIVVYVHVHEVDYYSDGDNNNIIVMRSWKRSNFPKCMGTLYRLIAYSNSLIIIGNGYPHEDNHYQLGDYQSIYYY